MCYIKSGVESHKWIEEACTLNGHNKNDPLKPYSDDKGDPSVFYALEKDRYCFTDEID